MFLSDFLYSKRSLPGPNAPAQYRPSVRPGERRGVEPPVSDHRDDGRLGLGGTWGRSSSLPKAPDQEVILLKKARGRQHFVKTPQ